MEKTSVYIERRQKRQNVVRGIAIFAVISGLCISIALLSNMVN